MKFPDVEAAVTRVWMRWRARSPRLDHLSRAADRFFDTHAGLLAAGISFYAFFAAFALVLTAFAGLGFILDRNSTVLKAVEDWLTTNLPTMDVSQIVDARGTVGMIALGGFIITGIAWVQALRASVRAVWCVEKQPGHPVVTWLLDAAVLLGLGLLLSVALFVGTLVEVLINLLVSTGDGNDLKWMATAGGLIVGVAVNTVLTVALLTALPRLSMGLNRVLVPAFCVALALEGIKTVGRIYIDRVEANPAYQLVTGTVGLLVFLQLFNEALLFAAAWTATSRRGKVTDLAVSPPAEVGGDPEGEAARTPP